MITNRILRAALPLAVLCMAASACTDDQQRALGEVDVRDSLHTAVEDAVAAQGGAVADDLDCTSSISASGAVEGACTGATEGGDAIAAAYSGTADVEAETCTADLTLTVGPTAVVTESGVDCFAT